MMEWVGLVRSRPLNTAYMGWDALKLCQPLGNNIFLLCGVGLELHHCLYPGMS